MTELKNKDEQYSTFLKYKESDDKENKFIIILRALFTVFVFTVLAVIIIHLIPNSGGMTELINKRESKGILNSDTGNQLDLTPSKFNFKMLNKYQNILLLGVDSNGPDTLPFSGVRSDTIIIINVDMHAKSINAVSVPRDSKVYLSDGHGVQKINAAYAIGGIDLAKKTIEETFGIKIHNYIIVNSEGVKKLINALGGIPVHIDQNMHYNDYSGKLHIDFQKGDYVLTGEQAEGYLRFRKDMLGDIGRVQRQQKFIKALIEHVKSPETFKKIPEALKIASLYTRTDMNLYQMSQYAAAARDIDLNKVEFVMLPGAPNKKGMLSYWILDPEKTQQVINRLIYRQKIDMARNGFSVGIIYSRSKEIYAMAIREMLKTEGYEVNCTGKSSQITKSQIIGYNTDVSDTMIKYMQKKIPEISEFDYMHNPLRSYCPDSDVVITLKEDEIL